jgi:hypothetical protein
VNTAGSGVRREACLCQSTGEAVLPTQHPHNALCDVYKNRIRSLETALADRLRGSNGKMRAEGGMHGESLPFFFSFFLPHYSFLSSSSLVVFIFLHFPLFLFSFYFSFILTFPIT